MDSLEAQQVDGWLTVEEAAAHLKLSPTTIYRHVKHEEIPHYRFGRAVRFKAAEIDQWARQFAVKPKDGAH